MNETLIPGLGAILRTLLTSAGLRRHLAKAGRDSDLDAAAIEARPISTSDLIHALETCCLKPLTDDCGLAWAELLKQEWALIRKAVQRFAAGADFSLVDPQDVEKTYRESFAVPLAAAFLARAFRQPVTPDVGRWWDAPFAAWVELAAARAGVPSNDLLNDGIGICAEVHPRTLQRWMKGEPVKNLTWPYLPKIEAALKRVRRKALKPLEKGDRQQLAGWLMVSVVFQAQAPEIRQAVRRRREAAGWHPGSVDLAIEAVNRRAFAACDDPVRGHAMKVLKEVEDFLERQPIKAAEVDARLVAFEQVFPTDDGSLPLSCNVVRLRLKARQAALAGRDNDAAKLYGQAVKIAWWRAGPRQQGLLRDALLHAVGIGRANMAQHLWDRIHLLGIAGWPKHELDEQELRRLSMAFESRFAPLKAKERVPPFMEVIFAERPHEVSRQAKKTPNAKVKHAEGGTRRTPLMEAVMRGTLSDVQHLIEQGGDPDSFIPESGDGPLTCTMRRALQSRDAAIMNFLLDRPLLKSTVNRPASTRRETPLKLAIEMADARAVERLIDLGAGMEAPCGHMPSALCYAIALFQTGLEGPTDQMIGYLQGKTAPDVFDAKRGYVLDSEVGHARTDLAARMLMRSDGPAMMQAVLEHRSRPVEQRRAVVRTLLRRGADPNCVYRLSPDSDHDWTPTLFAAQIGDIDMFKALVEHSGDIARTLKPASVLDAMDAMWIAVAYGRHAIVRYLREIGGRKLHHA